MLRRYFEEVWTKGNVAAMDELMWPDVVVHSLIAGGGDKSYDMASLRTLFEPMLGALSDVHVAVDLVVREGDLEAARCVITAVHHCDSMATMERAKPIFFTGMTIVRVREGRIAESWFCFDFETMYLQME